MTKTIHVLIADNSEAIRGVLRMMLEQQSDILVIGEAVNGAEAIELTIKNTPDVLILDMEMPVLSGIDVIKALMEAKSEVKILALSSYDDLFYIKSALALGVSGYLTKDLVIWGKDPKTKIVKAVRRAVFEERGILSEKAFRKLWQ